MECIEQQIIHEEKLDKVSQLMEQLVLDAMLHALYRIRENMGIEEKIAKEVMTGEAEF